LTGERRVESRDSNTLQRATVFIAIILGASALFVANDFFIPVALSLLLSALLWPVVRQLERWRIPAGIAAAMCILGTVGILVAAVAAFEPPVRKFANDIPKSIAAARPKLTRLSASFGKFMGSPGRKASPAAAPVSSNLKKSPTNSRTKPTSDSSKVTADSTAATNNAIVKSKIDSAEQANTDTVAKVKADSLLQTRADSTAKPKAKGIADKPVSQNSDFDLSSISGGASATLSRALGVASSLLGDLVEIMLLSMFVLAAGNTWRTRLEKSVSSPGMQQQVLSTVDHMRSVVSRYVLMITLINISQGLIVGFSLKLLGYPSPMLWGVLTFTFEFIPYLGGFVMVGLLLVAGLAAGRDFPAALYGPAVYLTVTTMQNSVLGPILYGRSLRLNPAAILASLMMWYMLWGVAGAFLSVPLLAAFNVLASRVPSLKGVHEFISD
jgi:predicted PurR-regulated permease PerM